MNTKLNKSDFILLGIYFLVSFTMQGVDYYRRDSYLREYLLDFPIELLTSSAIILIFIFWLTPKFIITKKYFLFGFLGVVVLVFFAAIDHIVGFWSGKNDWSKFPKGLDYLFSMIDRGTSISAFPFAILLTKKFYEGQTQLLKVEKQQKENELKLLRSQIDPHFLFNNLNTLDSLIDSDSKKAKEYINRLSLIYRYLIQTKDAEVMELSKEVEFAENYMFLIQTRFGNDYTFSIDRKVSLQDKFIPTGALQTLLENVVKHNKPDNGSTIKAVVTISERLEVSNTKAHSPQKRESLGTGLENLKARYQLLSDQKIKIEETDKKYQISIPIIGLSES